MGFRDLPYRMYERRLQASLSPDAIPRHAQVTVHLPAELSPDQLKRLTHVVDTCPVKRALEAGFTFDRQLVVQRKPPAVAQSAIVA